MESFLSFELTRGLSLKAETGQAHQEEDEDEDTHTNDASGKYDVGVVQGPTNELLLLSSTSTVSADTIASAPASSRFEAGGFGLPDAHEAANPMPSLFRRHGEAIRRTAPPVLAPSSRFTPGSDRPGVPNTYLGGDGGMVHGAGVVARPPEMSLTEPGFIGRGGGTDWARNKDELAEEDWLEVAAAMFGDVADP